MERPGGRLEKLEFAKVQYAAAADIYGRAFAAAVVAGGYKPEALAEKAVKEFNYMMNNYFNAEGM